MVLLDTSAWIEWLTGSDLGKRFAEHIPEPEDVLVPTIVQMELVKWAVREGSQGPAAQVLGATDQCLIIVLDSETAVRAALLGAEHRLSTADAIIYATALAHDAELLTCDRHFQDLPRVRYLPKPPR
jgi:hypothetical protein